MTSETASASQPQGQQFGPWNVISISSLSGTADDDAFVLMTQGEEPNSLQVDWTQGGNVVVSINIEKCSGETDFEASYSVEPKRWLQLSRQAIEKRLRADMLAWLGQAKLACRSTTPVDAFKLDGLHAAASDFTERLRLLAGGPD